MPDKNPLDQSATFPSHPQEHKPAGKKIPTLKGWYVRGIMFLSDAYFFDLL